MSNDRFKFRVWNDFHKTYDKIYVIDCDGKHYVRTPASAALDLLEPGNETFNIIEQCTGLKDKNGNLIYESDIVQFEDIVGIVKWGTYDADDCGGKNAILGFYIDWDDPCYLYRKDMGYWGHEDIKIIGNVHTEEPK